MKKILDKILSRDTSEITSEIPKFSPEQLKQLARGERVSFEINGTSISLQNFMKEREEKILQEDGKLKIEEIKYATFFIEINGVVKMFGSLMEDGTISFRHEYRHKGILCNTILDQLDAQKEELKNALEVEKCTNESRKQLTITLEEG